MDVARGSIMMGRILAMNPGTTDREIEGIKTTEPTFGLPAVWIPGNKKQEAQVAGYTVVDPATVIATHIKETIKRHAHELMGRQEVQALLDKFKETNPIDTTGRSHQDKDYSRQLKEIFDAVGGVEIHLVLSVTSQEKLFTATYRQFSPIGVDRVLFTKLDEGLSFGSLFNFSVRNRLPISYFTSGQRVPEDLEVARPERVISLIFN